MSWFDFYGIEGIKKHWSGVWRGQHWPNGFDFSGCSWWWEACHWVSLFQTISTVVFSINKNVIKNKSRFRFRITELSLILVTFVWLKYVLSCYYLCRVIPKTLMPREVCLCLLCSSLPSCFIFQCKKNHCNVISSFMGLNHLNHFALYRLLVWLQWI